MRLQGAPSQTVISVFQGGLDRIHVRGVEVLADFERFPFGPPKLNLFSLECLIDAIDGERRADRDGKQQNQRCGDEARQRGFAPAPAPEFFSVANGMGVNRFGAQETV